MINFKNIQEGILGDIDDTITKSDATINKLKEVSDVRKCIPLLSKIWDKHSDGPLGKRNTDYWCQDIKIGDIVLFNDGDLHNNDYSFGVVVDKPANEHVRIICTEARFAYGPEDDPYRDCVSYTVPVGNVFILARKKDAINILKIIEKV